MSVDWKDLLGQGAITAAQYEMLTQSQDNIAAIPEQIRTGMTQVSDMASPYTNFTPFAVTTGSGATTTLGPQGLSMQMSPEQQQFNSMLQQQAMQKAQQAGSVTPQSLLAEMTALRQPEQQRAQLGLENRLAAQGRLGVQTNAYGGTPEQLAMQKAIQEQQSADSLAAITGARNLQQQDLGLAEGMLGLSYANENQALNTLSPALQAQQIGAGLGQTQANLIGQLGQQYLGEVGSAGRTGANLSQNQMNMLIQSLLGPGGGGSAGGSGGGGSAGGDSSGSFVGNLLSGLFSSGDSSNDYLQQAIDYFSGGSQGVQPVTMDSFTGAFNYDPNAEVDYFGGGVNLPPTTIGGGGI